MGHPVYVYVYVCMYMCVYKYKYIYIYISHDIHVRQLAKEFHYLISCFDGLLINYISLSSSKNEKCFRRTL